MFIWDVQVVLQYLKSLGNNELLCLSDLTHKLTMLLALTAASRASAIQHLNLHYMCKNDEKYVFFFHKLHKSWKQGCTPPEVTYFAYPQDKTLCVVEPLNSYIQATGSFRNWTRIFPAATGCM